MQKILRYLNTEEGDSDLVEDGREVWYGHSRSTVAVVNRLLNLCLINISGGKIGEGAVYYKITEEGVMCLRSYYYVPLILRQKT